MSNAERLHAAVTVADALSGASEPWYWDESDFPGDGSGGLVLLDIGSTIQYFQVLTTGDFFHDAKFYALYADADNYVCVEPVSNDPGNTAIPGYFMSLRVRTGGVDYWFDTEQFGAAHGGNRLNTLYVNRDLNLVGFTLISDGGSGASDGTAFDVTSLAGAPLPSGTQIGWDLSGGDGAAQATWDGFDTFYGSTGPGYFLAATKPISDKPWIRSYGTPPNPVGTVISEEMVDFRYTGDGVAPVPEVPDDVGVIVKDVGVRSGSVKLTAVSAGIPGNNALRVVMRSRTDLTTWSPYPDYDGDSAFLYAPWGWFVDGGRALARPTNQGWYGDTTVHMALDGETDWSSGDVVESTIYDVLSFDPVAQYCGQQDTDLVSTWNDWIVGNFTPSAPDETLPIQPQVELRVNDVLVGQADSLPGAGYYYDLAGVGNHVFNPDLVGRGFGVLVPIDMPVSKDQLFPTWTAFSFRPYTYAPIAVGTAWPIGDVDANAEQQWQVDGTRSAALLQAIKDFYDAWSMDTVGRLDIVGYEWFGDGGAVLSGHAVDVLTLSTGTNALTLRVTNSAGLQAEHAFNVEVEIPPVIPNLNGELQRNDTGFYGKRY